MKNTRNVSRDSCKATLISDSFSDKVWTYTNNSGNGYIEVVGYPRVDLARVKKQVDLKRLVPL